MLRFRTTWVRTPVRPSLFLAGWTVSPLFFAGRQCSSGSDCLERTANIAHRAPVSIGCYRHAGMVCYAPEGMEPASGLKWLAGRSGSAPSQHCPEPRLAAIFTSYTVPSKSPWSYLSPPAFQTPPPSSAASSATAVFFRAALFSPVKVPGRDRGGLWCTLQEANSKEEA